MNIAIVTPNRSSEKAISGYSEHLIFALRKNNLDVDVIEYTAGSPFSLIKKLKGLKKYDIIHLQHEYNLLGYYGLPFFPALFLMKLLGKGKLIVTMHTALSKKTKFKGNVLKNFLRKVLYFTQNRMINYTSYSIFVHSDFFVPILTEEYGFPKRKIEVFPQGIIDNIKISSKSKAKRKLGLSGPVYLIIGHLTPDSGLDIILKQARKIGSTILIVSNPTSVNDRGDKRLKNYLDSSINFVNKNGLQKYVRFDIKPISDKDQLWWDYFNAADFVIQAYRGSIGSGIFTHAMATKTPVITSDIPFFKDISQKYDCLRIVNKDEDYAKIIKEAIEPKTYKKLVKGCEKYLKDNSWNSIAKKYVEVYQRL